MIEVLHDHILPYYLYIFSKAHQNIFKKKTLQIPLQI